MYPRVLACWLWWRRWALANTRAGAEPEPQPQPIAGTRPVAVTFAVAGPSWSQAQS